jgi:hypothetical protein
LSGVTVDPQTSNGTFQRDIYDCYRQGLEHFLDAVNDHPPTVPRTVVVSETWMVRHVTKDQGLSALESAKQALTAQGWAVTARTQTTAGLVPPRVQAGPAPSSVHLEFRDYGDVEVSAYAGCARFPDGTPTDEVGDPILPKAKGVAP